MGIYMMDLLSHIIDSTPFLYIDGEKNKSQQNIMERLVAFCGSQSTESMSGPLKGLNLIR